MPGLGFSIGMGAGTKQGLDAATVVAELLDRKRRTGLAEQEIGQRERQIAEQEAMNRFTRGKGLIEMGDIEAGAPMVGGSAANIRDPALLSAIQMMIQFAKDPQTAEQALVQEAVPDSGRRQAVTMLRDIINKRKPGSMPTADQAPTVDTNKLYDILRRVQASKEHLSPAQLFAKAVLNPEIIPEESREQFMKHGYQQFGSDAAMMRALSEQQRVLIAQLQQQLNEKRDTANIGFKARETAAKEAEVTLKESEDRRKHGETILNNRKSIYDRISAETRNIDDNISKQMEAAGKDYTVLTRDPTGKDKRTPGQKVEDVKKELRKQANQQKLVIHKRALSELRAAKDQYGISEMEATIKDLEARIEKEGKAPLQGPR